MLCFAVALWNGVDPILKERMFGLTNAEGNHGEDVKEYYFYLDATPTRSYLKYRYRYPLAEYPYDDLIATNRAREAAPSWSTSCSTPAIFDDDRYVDVDVEYAKAATRRHPGPHHRAPTAAPDAATVHLLPTLWFRNTGGGMDEPKGTLHAPAGARRRSCAEHPDLGALGLRCDGDADGCCSPRTRRTPSGCAGTPNATPYVKDAFHDYVVDGEARRGEPGAAGTKAAAHYVLDDPGRRPA